MVRGAELDRRESRALYNGFGDTLTRAVEFVAIPMLFGFLGYLLDGALGTRPVLVVVLAAFALAGVFLRAYFAYAEAMREEESTRPWANSAALRERSS